jgi:hypothetical protein
LYISCKARGHTNVPGGVLNYLCLTESKILLSGISFCISGYFHTSYPTITHIHPE